MNKIFLPPWILLLGLLAGPVGSQDSEAYEDLYGFKTVFPKSAEVEWNIMEICYQKGGLFDQLRALNQGTLDWKIFDPYFDKVNDQDLLGATLRDSLLLYFTPRFNEELLSRIKPLEAKNPAIGFIVGVRSHLNDFTSQGFNFSTVLGPRKIPLGGELRMLLPKAQWTPLEKKDQTVTLQAGNDDNAGIVFFQIVDVKGSREDFLRTNYFMKEKVYLKNIPVDRDFTEEDMYQVKPTPFKRIQNPAFRSIFGPADAQSFDEIYEQITAPDQIYLQNGISRTRIYFYKNKGLIVHVSNIISQHHALFDTRRIIQVLGYLLDTLQFNNFKIPEDPQT